MGIVLNSNFKVKKKRSKRSYQKRSKETKCLPIALTALSLQINNKVYNNNNEVNNDITQLRIAKSAQLHADLSKQTSTKTTITPYLRPHAELTSQIPPGYVRGL